VMRSSQQRCQGMTGRECLDHCRELFNLVWRSADAEAVTIFLEQVNAGAAVGGIDHQIDRAGRSQNTSQRAQALVRVGKVMQDAGADDQIEAMIQGFNVFDRNVLNFEVAQAVLAFESFSFVEAGRADINTNYLRRRMAERVFGRLPGSASG